MKYSDFAGSTHNGRLVSVRDGNGHFANDHFAPKNLWRFHIASFNGTSYFSLGFHDEHAHWNDSGPCQSKIRWDNDHDSDFAFVSRDRYIPSRSNLQGEIETGWHGNLGPRRLIGVKTFFYVEDEEE